MTLVFVALGHSTLTPTGAPDICSSVRSVSDSDTTPTFATAYGARCATPLTRPAIDAVFTM